MEWHIDEIKKIGRHKGEYIEYMIRTTSKGYGEFREMKTSDIQKYQNYIRKLRAYRKYHSLCNPKESFFKLQGMGIWYHEDILDIK